MDESFLEKPVKYASIFTALFLILEAAKIIFYYWLWDFNVIPYMTLEFYFSQFVGDIGIFLALGLMIVGMPGLAVIIAKLIPYWKKPILYFYLICLVILLPIVLGYAFCIIFDTHIGVSTGIILFVVLLFSFEHIIPIPDIDNIPLKVTIKRISKWYEETVGSADTPISTEVATPKHAIGQVIVPIFIIAFVSVSAYCMLYQHDRLKNYYYLRKTEIFLNDSTSIPLMGNQYYIGNTPDFYFTYTDSLESVRVIKADDVKEVRIKRLNDVFPIPKTLPKK